MELNGAEGALTGVDWSNKRPSEAQPMFSLRHKYHQLRTFLFESCQLVSQVIWLIILPLLTVLARDPVTCTNQ